VGSGRGGGGAARDAEIRTKAPRPRKGTVADLQRCRVGEGSERPSSWSTSGRCGCPFSADQSGNRLDPGRWKARVQVPLAHRKFSHVAAALELLVTRRRHGFGHDEHPSPVSQPVATLVRCAERSDGRVAHGARRFRRRSKSLCIVPSGRSTRRVGVSRSSSFSRAEAIPSPPPMRPAAAALFPPGASTSPSASMAAMHCSPPAVVGRCRERPGVQCG
jgi:hypothetical protein